MKYKVFYHEVKIEDLIFTSAGIEVANQNGDIIKKFYDVSTDFNGIEQFVSSLNYYDADIDEFETLLEDYYLEHY